MNVSCPQCSTVYRVDPAKVPEGGVRARCSTCSGVIPVGVTTAPPPRRATPVDALGAAFGARPPGPYAPAGKTPQAQAPARATPPRPAPARQTPVTPVRQAPVTPVRQTPVTPVRQTPVASQAVSTPQSAAAPISVPPAQSPQLGASLPAMKPTPRTSWPAVTPEAATPPAASASETAGNAAEPEQSGSATRRPINPFLARDPSLRAKRLARALVSDMVAYYPAKHSEGLEKGTLKELFRDEIKKSYDEYVAQVGADFARSTTHFQESLNEVLGAGKKIF
ncbi:MAG: zinc-ribbon domain-containing protein [Gemmatimonadaceae bacterium]